MISRSAITEIHFFLHDLCRAVPERIDDAAPVRVAPVPTRLHERTISDSAGCSVSLVLIPPSTVMRLKLWATASLKAAWRARFSIAASLVRKQSIVACSPAAAGRRPLALMAG